MSNDNEDDGFITVQRKKRNKLEEQIVQDALRNLKTGIRNNNNEPYPYKKMSIIPTFKEILSKKIPYLKVNKLTGAFPNPGDYVETHFRLFHEDFLRPLRIGVQDYIKNYTFYERGEKEVPVGNVHVYQDVTYTKHSKFVQLQRKDFEDVEDWEESKLFLPGNLLIFSNDNFGTAHRATILNFRDEKELKLGIVRIDWVDEAPVDLMFYKFTMIESGSFFQFYRYTLKVLREMIPESLPLAKFIVSSSSDVRAPKYLASFSRSIVLGGRYVSLMNSRSWPEPRELHLNDNQFKALKSCLTKEFAIVQGPPGTGKTFVALLVVEILLRNPDMWNPKSEEPSPILIVSFTNHALDQFLEGVLKIYEKLGQTPRLVRVGGRGESEDLKPYHISKMKKWGIRNAHIIGMTTTGAAKYNDLLEMCRPRIVIVEEAAEVLESHIIPCLLPNCQHLILIGDHQQLQPFTKVQELSAKFHLDISLFERMVNNNLHLCTLNVQHRMRPEISDLITGTIYEDLKNAPNVLTYPEVLGMRSNLYFVTHAEIESTTSMTLSKVNMYEARYLLALCSYMIQQGYSPKQITILATYNGQVDVLKEFLKPDETLVQIEVTTVDGFQGKENDIILLSLVRSNDEAQIGFLKRDNRICVALSRAKHGLFIVGNMDQLSQKSSTWREVRRKLGRRSAIGPSLPIKCQIHGVVQNIQKPADFNRFAAEGGCLLPCGLKLTCGHACQSRCHKSDHYDYKCQLSCSRTCPRGHPCSSVCSEPCPPCMVPWKSLLLCSHEVPVPCYLASEESESRCQNLCRKPCGYVFSEEEDGCGHTCNGDCYSCMQGRLHVKCLAECQRLLPCGHKCNSVCFEDCPPCRKACCNVKPHPLKNSILTPSENTAGAIHSFLNETTALNRYFPYVKAFIQKKLTKNGTQGLWAMHLVVELLKSAVKIVSGDLIGNQTFKTDLVERFYSFFYTLIIRFPWGKEELKSSQREFQRLRHLARTYYMATLMSIRTTSEAQCKTTFDRIYNILGARKVYSDAAQKDVYQLFEELANHLLDHGEHRNIESWFSALRFFT